MIKAEEKLKLEKIFEDISENGLLGGPKAKEMMLQTSIPVDILAKIWDMSDIDKDGSLNQNEFIISMYLINKAKAGNMPDFLPNEFFQSLGYSSMSQPSNMIDSYTNGTQHNGQIMFSQLGDLETKINDTPESIFKILDTNNDNLVDGSDCKNLFLATKLPQLVLAQIWNICDTKQIGLLDLDLFRLAWYLVNQKLKNNIDPPSQFYPELLELSKKSMNSSQILTEEDYKEIPGGPQILSLMKEISEIENEKIAVEKTIELRTIELREKNDAYHGLKHEVELVLQNVKSLEAGKEVAQHKLDELVLEEKRQNGAIEDIRAECAKLEEKINGMQKLDGNKNGQTIPASKSIEDLLREEADLKEQIKSSESRLDGFKSTPQQPPYVLQAKLPYSQQLFDSVPTKTFDTTFDDAFGNFTTTTHSQNTFGSFDQDVKGVGHNGTLFQHDPFATTTIINNDTKGNLFPIHNSNHRPDFSSHGFDDDPFAPKETNKIDHDAYAKFDAF